jgi:hypothetical protein
VNIRRQELAEQTRGKLREAFREWQPAPPLSLPPPTPVTVAPATPSVDQASHPAVTCPGPPYPPPSLAIDALRGTGGLDWLNRGNTDTWRLRSPVAEGRRPHNLNYFIALATETRR